MAFLRKDQPRSLVGGSLLAVGLVLLAAAGAYYAYVTFIATRGADSLTVAPLDDRSETLAGPSGATTTGRPSPAWQELHPGALLPAASRAMCCWSSR